MITLDEYKEYLINYFIGNIYNNDDSKNKTKNYLKRRYHYEFL